MNTVRNATVQFVVISVLLVSTAMAALEMMAANLDRKVASKGQATSPKCVPPFRKSALITKVIFDKYRFHKGDGDTWPLTWASDGNLYGAAGDNMGSPMNFWKIIGVPGKEWWVELIDNLPIDPAVYCQRANIDHKNGVKPGGVLSINGTLYFAVENMNYGDNPKFNRQHNLNAWIVTSTDFGKTWNRSATPQDFFTGRLGSPHFLQFGKDYAGARDGYVYLLFAAGDDGNAYWENNDYILLGRVPKDKMLNRQAWEFFTGTGASGEPNWDKDDKLAKPVFRYPLMTGEDHVSYDRGIKRYLLGNYGFMDEGGNPRPYHQAVPKSVYPSQLTLYEAPEPWGPWTLFYRDDNWGTYGDYNPSFPTKWMSEDGKTLWMVAAGTYDDYCFTAQKLTLALEK